MDETLRQLGGLLLGSIPTILLFLVTFFAYRLIVHGRLEQVLHERYQRTEGAIEKARADVASAEAKTSEYEQRLREARMAIFRAQEARRQKALAARAAAMAEARERARQQVAQARSHVSEELEAAKRQLIPESERLAGEVIRAILKPVAVAQSPAGGGQ
ncbi:MAG: F0F1 ATP synthase subunit B family protein [Terriglobales bacterium]